MPNNWKTYKLGDIANIGSSKRIFRADYVETGIPFYRSKEIIQKSFGQELDEVLYIDKEKYNKIKQKFGAPKSGDILLSAVGNRSGIPYLVNNDGEFYFKDGNLMWFRDFQNYVNSSFLVYWFKSSVGQHYLNSTMIGSAQKALTIESVKNIEVSVPPLPEQKAIANILSAIDDKIENNLAIKKTLEDMAMALYKHWFVDFGPFQDGEFIDSELGPIPKGWEVKRLDEVCNKIYSGGTPKTKEPAYWNGNIPWLSSGETRNKFVVETDKFITKLGLKKSSSKMAYIGNTVIASAGQGKTRGQTSYLFIDTSINQSVIVLEANEEIIHKETLFLDLSTRYDEFRMISDSFSTRGSLTTKLLSSQIKLPLPNIKLQTDFNNQITKYFNSIESNIKENQSLTQLRDTLLPKLISGEVRLKEFKEQIESVL